MSVKSQLRACTDFLMVGMKAAERTNSENSKQVVRKCMDYVELLVRQAEAVKAPEVEATLQFVNREAAELQASDPAAGAVIAALRNAVGRLHALLAELKGGQVAPR